MPVSSSASRSAQADGCSSPSKKPYGSHQQPSQGSIARRVRSRRPSWTTSAPAAGFAFSQWLVPQAVQVTGACAPIQAPQFEQWRGIYRSIASSSPSAPVLSSGSFRFPLFGDCTHEGQPCSHGQPRIIREVSATQSPKTS